MRKQPKLLAAAVAIASLSSGSYASLALEEVIVTAQKREQSLQDVPLSVDVLTADTLDRRNITDVKSLTQVAPSVNFQDGFSPASTSFNIRGIATYSFEGGIQPSTGIVVDGVAYARAGEYIAELSDIERVEILRGPQGTLFGRNTTAGAINIVTKRPGDELGGGIEVSMTDDQERLYRGSISGPLSDNVGASISAFYKDFDGIVENIYPGADNGGAIDTWGFQTKLDVNFSDNVNVLFSADYRDAIMGSPASVTVAESFFDGLAPDGGNFRDYLHGNGDSELGARIIADPLKINVNDPDSFDESLTSYGFSADLTWEISDNVTLKSITSYRDWSQAANPDIDASPGQASNGGFGLIWTPAQSNLSVAPDARSWNFGNNYFTQEIRLEGSDDSLDWIAGVFYTDFEENLRGSVEVIIPAFGNLLNGSQQKNSDELTAYSAFVDLTFHLTETIDVFGGFRWSQEDAEVSYNANFYAIPGTLLTIDPLTNLIFVDTTDPTFGPVNTVVGDADEEEGDWSGRLGISWQATENVNLYASASRGYIGIATNLGRDGSPTNAFLEPTTAESFELGIKSRLFDNRVQLNGAIYSQEVSNLQTAVLLPGTISTTSLNAGNLEILGAEADIIVSFNDYARLSVGVAYTDAETHDLVIGCYAEQTFELGCNLDANGDPVGSITAPGQGNTLIDGDNAPNAPELKYNVTLDVDVPLSDLPFDGYASVSYVWQDDVVFALNQDPLSVQEDYGLLDISLGITDNEGRWELSVYGKNVTDEFFANGLSDASGFIGRIQTRVTRGAHAYYGARFKYNF